MIIPILESSRLKIEEQSELRTENEHTLETKNFVFYVVL